MLWGLAGLTAIASSDSFRCRWLMSILAGGAAKAPGPARAAASAAGVAASTAPARIAATAIGDPKRDIIEPSSPPPLPKGTPGPCGLGRARCARTDAGQEAADDEPAAFPMLRNGDCRSGRAVPSMSFFRRLTIFGGPNAAADFSPGESFGCDSAVTVAAADGLHGDPALFAPCPS